MNGLLYYLLTFAEATLGVVGIRAYEQPPYTVVERLAGEVEVRDYPALVAAETDAVPDRSEAFRRLFRYIDAGNGGEARIAMTAPVAQRVPAPAGVTEDVGSGRVMRFFLPRDVVAGGVPAPRDPQVRIVTVPAERVAVRRFSGWPSDDRVAAEDRRMLATLAGCGRQVLGPPVLLTYDAPFTLPFARRNEVAVAIGR